MDEKRILEIVNETINEYKNTPFVKVGVSNRHAHLSREDVDLLFGEGYQLTPMKELLPGQYACKEIINIKGKKGIIEKVRVLGPERTASQIEVSLTDSFTLGEKLVVAESGDLSKAAELVLINPLNNKQITRKCAIAALRHIHLTPEFAEKYNLKDKQFVSLQFDGIRQIRFDKVLIRVSKDFYDEIHIDTDEANAGFIKNGDFGLIIS